MNDEHIKLGFVKTKPIESLKREFSEIPLEHIQSIEKEYQNEHGGALLKEAKIENLTSNFLKAIFLVALTTLIFITTIFYFTPFTLNKVFTGILLGIFIGLPILLMVFISYLLAVLAISEIIKHVFFFKQTKFLEKLRKEKAYIAYQKCQEERRSELEQQIRVKSKMDSVLRDIETLRNHFSHTDHTPLISSSKLENSVSEIVNAIVEWAIYEKNRKDKTDSNEIESYKKLLFLLAHVEKEDYVETVNKLVKLMSLINPDDTTSELSKSLLIEISNLSSENPRVLNHIADALRRYEEFLTLLETAH